MGKQQWVFLCLTVWGIKGIGVEVEIGLEGRNSEECIVMCCRALLAMQVNAVCQSPNSNDASDERPRGKASIPYVLVKLQS